MGYGPWGLNFWEIVILLWLFASFFKPKDSRRIEKKFDDFHHRYSNEKAAYEEVLDNYEEDLDAAENKIEKLEDRIRVLERIVTDEHKTDSLKDEIESLRQ